MRLSRSGIGLSLLVHALAVCALMRAVWHTPQRSAEPVLPGEIVWLAAPSPCQPRLRTDRRQPDRATHRQTTLGSETPRSARPAFPAGEPHRAAGRDRRAVRSVPSRAAHPNTEQSFALPTSPKRAGAPPLTFSRTAHAPTRAARLRSPARSRSSERSTSPSAFAAANAGLVRRSPCSIRLPRDARGWPKSRAASTASTGSRTTATCSASRPSALRSWVCPSRPSRRPPARGGRPARTCSSRPSRRT